MNSYVLIWRGYGECWDSSWPIKMPWSLVHPLPFGAVTFLSYTVRPQRLFHPGRFWGGPFVTISSMFRPSQLPGLWQVDPQEENSIVPPDRTASTHWFVRHWPLLILALQKVRQTRTEHHLCMGQLALCPNYLTPKVGRPLFWSAGPLIRCPADYRNVSGPADWKK